MLWIILWIFQSFMNAFGMVLSKKVVENKAVWNNWQTFISRANHVIFIIIIFFIFSIFSINIETIKFELPENIINYTNIFLFMIATIWILLLIFLEEMLMLMKRFQFYSHLQCYFKFFL